MILAFIKYCYFWIDILEFLTRTFEPAPSMFSYGAPPGHNIRGLKQRLREIGTSTILFVYLLVPRTTARQLISLTRFNSSVSCGG